MLLTAMRSAARLVRKPPSATVFHRRSHFYRQRRVILRLPPSPLARRHLGGHPGARRGHRNNPTGPYRLPTTSAPQRPSPQRSPGSGHVCLNFRSEEHTSELQSRGHLVSRLLFDKKTNI